MEGIRRVLVLGLVLIAGTAIEQAPSVSIQGAVENRHVIINQNLIINID